MISMRAILTSDLFHKGNERLVITTCSDMLNHIPAINEFIRNRGIPAKLTTDFDSVKMTLSGERLMECLHDIERFIQKRMNDK
jgi:hypothetical protein